MDEKELFRIEGDRQKLRTKKLVIRPGAAVMFTQLWLPEYPIRLCKGTKCKSFLGNHAIGEALEDMVCLN